ncbi:unnamed protein product, partial [Closterium sp. Naga37s-1]
MAVRSAAKKAGAAILAARRQQSKFVGGRGGGSDARGRERCEGEGAMRGGGSDARGRGGGGGCIATVSQGSSVYRLAAKGLLLPLHPSSHLSTPAATVFQGSSVYRLAAKGRSLVRLSTGGSTKDKSPRGKAHAHAHLPVPLTAALAATSYRRVGRQGNQLVRDSKAAMRTAAGARVRYSLQNARYRRQKQQQQLCQYFTRLGQCNKKDCRFLHDASKVALCVRFIRGMECDESRCKLTHKIIPERMPDCTFFSK